LAKQYEKKLLELTKNLEIKKYTSFEVKELTKILSESILANINNDIEKNINSK